MLRAVRTSTAVRQIVLRTTAAQNASSPLTVAFQHPTTVAATFDRQTTVRWLSDASKTNATEDAAKEDTAATTEEADPPPPPADGEADAAEEPAAAPVLSKEEELTQELQQVKDQLLRSLAEQDNTRRIATRDMEHARSFAIKSFAKSLLDVSDNLERALAAVPAESISATADSSNNDVLKTLYEGIQLTEKGLHKAFTANGLVKYGAPGDVFDPTKHEALMEYSDPKATPGTIGQLMKPGYLLHSRVLRPAEVGVIKKA